jgi:hypothetical protein
MDNNDVANLFDCVMSRSRFECYAVQDAPPAYNLETSIKIFGDVHYITISATAYPMQNVLMLIMFVSQGFSGDRSDFIDKLLLRLNSGTQSGAFGVWPENGDIIYRRELFLRGLSCKRLCAVLENMLSVYIITKTQLDQLSSKWQLTYVTEEEVEHISQQITSQIQSMAPSLSVLE